ncbi:MAG: HNH endonuclease [Porphyrobacter sp.]|nr:HNH endonuclease [Porphyrobacter sp.]
MKANINSEWVAVGVMTLNSKYARRLRLRLAKEQQDRCCYCGRSFSESGPTRPTLEHRKPKRDGGRDAVANLAVACFHCNQHRGKQINQSRTPRTQPTAD